MTYQTQIRAAADRACAAVAEIEPALLHLVESLGAHTSLQFSQVEFQISLHSVDLTWAQVADLLRQTFPAFEVLEYASGQHRWATAVQTVDGFRMAVTIFAKPEQLP